MNQLNVLMMGGRRCGKTSALASLFQIMKDDEKINNIFTVSDITNNVEGQEALSDKIKELKNMLTYYNSKVFMVDNSPTREYLTYTLRLRMKNYHNIELAFTDVSGEVYRANAAGSEKEAVREKINNCNVFIVVVDAPYLMECDPQTCDAVNAIDPITDFLKNINESKIGEPKLVVFAPIKCEKWVKDENDEGKRNLWDKFYKAYSVLIKALRKEKNLTLLYLPMQTAGSIQFKEMKDAYILFNPENEWNGRKCCRLGTEMIRDSEGNIRKKTELDELKPDNDAVIIQGKHGVTRPFTWFEIDKNADAEHLYSPKDCEQLPFHILNFYVDTLKRERQKEIDKNENEKSWFRKLLDRIGITEKEYNEFTRTMEELNDSGMIKTYPDGIRYI